MVKKVAKAERTKKRMIKKKHAVAKKIARSLLKAQKKAARKAL